MAGSPLMASGRFEPAETGLVRKLLVDLDLFVNVGANVDPPRPDAGGAADLAVLALKFFWVCFIFCNKCAHGHGDRRCVAFRLPLFY